MRPSIRTCIILKNANLNRRCKHVCALHGWRVHQLELAASQRATLSKNYDIILTDDSQLLGDSKRDNLARNLSANSAPIRNQDQTLWVLIGVEPPTGTDAHCVSLAVDFTDEQFTQAVTVALNVGRFKEQFFDNNHPEPITKLPHHPELLDMMTTHRHEPTGLVIVQIDHAQHLYANLDPVSKTDLLGALSNHLQDCLPKRAVMGIFDAACFAIWVPQATPNQISAVAHTLQQCGSNPVSFRGGQLHFTLSAGYAFESVLGDPQALWQSSWRAKEQAQELGGNRVASANDRNDIAKRIPRAFEREEFSLALQPQFDLQNQSLRGAEALLRWQGLEVGKLAPDHFIPIAERSGQMARVGDWVLENACRASTGWLEALQEPFTLALNTSPHQFRHGAIAKQIRRLGQQHWISPSMLEIELTHGNLLHTIDHHRQTLYELRDLGVRTAIDNLGASVVDTEKLLRCPADTLKIDRSVIARLETDDNARRLCDHICELGTRFSLTVVAVGVETEAQRDLLIASGCQVAQGFLLGKPQSALDFSTYLAHKQRAKQNLAQ